MWMDAFTGDQIGRRLPAMSQIQTSLPAKGHPSPAAFATSGLLDEVLQAHASLPARPPAPFVPVDVSWCYGVGNPAEGPHPDFSARPPWRESIRTPHLVLLPDTPLWYESLFEADKPTILKIIGDDGVQVFINGIWVRSIGCNLFPTEAGPGQTLTIRIINNAQHGGLLSVERAPLSAYRRWEEQDTQHRQLERLVRKLTAIPCPPPAAVSRAAHHVLAALQEPSDQQIGDAENALGPWPLVLAGPYIQDAALGRMIIRWETDTPGEAVVDWSVVESGHGESTAPIEWQFTRRVTSDNGLFDATLSDLPPGREMAYRIRQGETVSPVYFSRTPAAKGDFQFTVWGDSQTGWPTLRRLLDLMQSDPPDLTVGVGDLVNTGCMREQWLGFFATIQPFAARWPFRLMPGNHDYDGYYDDFVPELFRHYARRADEPNYMAWTQQNVRFVAIDPNETFPISIRKGSEQHDWLLKECDSPSWHAADWRIVFVHQPCFSQGKPDGYEGDLRIRDLIGPLAEKSGIDFIISGHTHDYERLKVTHPDGSFTHHLVVGGAGASLTPAHPEQPRVIMDRLLRIHHFVRLRISGLKAELEVIDLDGRRRDHLMVTKPSPRVS